MGMPEAEIEEVRHCRLAFPRVPQHLYPHQRPDTVTGDYLHFTQLPKHVKTDSTTHLSPTYQILIRFDSHYHNMTKDEVQIQATERFHRMGIPLATRFREPIIAMAGGKLKRWFGFLKVDLLHPETDGLNLLQGHRVFALALQDGELTIGKVEKGYDCPTTSLNRRLQIESPIIATRNTRQLLAELIEAGYYSGQDLEIVGVSKPNRTSTSATITVTTESSKQYLLAHPPVIQQETVAVSNIAAETGTLDPPGSKTTTTIIVRNLPRRASKTLVTLALHKLLGTRNVLTISYSNAQGDPSDRHNGIAFLTCLNTQVYTMWCRRKAVEFLGHFIDFEPHFQSIDGSTPSHAARLLDSLPTRQLMADAITAISNSTTQPPALTEATFIAAITKVEQQMDQRLTALGEQINGHTSTQVQTASTTIIAHTAAVQHRINRLSTAFKEFSARVVGLTSAIDTNLENFIMPASDATTPMRLSPPTSSAPQLPPPPNE